MLHCARQNNFGCTQHLLPAALTLHSSLSKSSFTSSSPSQFNILKSCVRLRQIWLILPKFWLLIIHGQDKSWAYLSLIPKFSFTRISVRPILPYQFPVRLACRHIDSLTQWQLHNALWGSWKMGSKVANFDKLFLCQFWSKISKILHIAPLTPQLPK